MCDKIFIKRDLLESENISDEALAVYCAICKNYIKYSNNSPITFFLLNILIFYFMEIWVQRKQKKK